MLLLQESPDRMSVDKRLTGCNLRSFVPGFALATLLVISAGCGEVKVEFQPSERVSTLMPAAEEYVRIKILEDFGQPGDMRCPPEAPVDRGGFIGEITEVIDDKTLVVNPEGTWKDDVQPGQRVEVLVEVDPYAPPPEDEEGEEAKKAEPVEYKVVSYDAEKKQLTLNHPVPEGTDVGVQVAVDPCRSLRTGQSLYMQHCVHCHGVTGDGKGPTGKYLNPKPRDYRLGIMKFTSTMATERASTEDLHRIIVEGVAGTYMPSFKLLPEHEVELITNYVKFLAVRGEMEKRLVDELGFEYSKTAIKERLEGGETQEEIDNLLAEFLKYDFPGIAYDTMIRTKEDWERADDPASVVTPSVPMPEPYAKSLADPTKTSVENGRHLYLTKAQCVACHGNTGRGDGVQTRLVQEDRDGNRRDKPGLFDEWGNMTPPRNLAHGIYRGGQRPVDLFRRVYAGVKGTKMPPAGGAALTDEQIWDVVNYVLSVPEHGPSGETPKSAVSQRSRSKSESEGFASTKP